MNIRLRHISSTVSLIKVIIVSFSTFSDLLHWKCADFLSQKQTNRITSRKVVNVSSTNIVWSSCNKIQRKLNLCSPKATAASWPWTIKFNYKSIPFEWRFFHSDPTCRFYSQTNGSMVNSTYIRYPNYRSSNSMNIRITYFFICLL